MTADAATRAAEPAHTEQSVAAVLYRHLIGQGWAPLVHVTADSAYQPDADRAAGKKGRVIDMLAVRSARRRGIGPLDLLAIEIKCSRGDFRADVRDPAKQAAWKAIAHRHAYAVPAGLVRREELPAGSGLIEVDRHGMRWAVRAPYTTAPELPTSLVLTFAHRMARAEALLRGLDPQSPPGDAEALRAEVARLRGQVERLTGRAARAETARDGWRDAFAAVNGGPPCAACGHPVRPVISRGHITDWRHCDTAHDAPCLEIRQELADARARAKWDQMSDDERDSYRRWLPLAPAEPWRALHPTADRVIPVDTPKEDRP